MTSLIYFYSGNEIPFHYCQSYNQAKQVSPETKIYFITNKGNEYKEDKHIEWIFIEDIEMTFKLPYNDMYKNHFWSATIMRYFYIYEFMKMKKLTDVFHCEGDVLLYTGLDLIKELFVKEDGFYAPKDSEHRAIGSLIYISNEDVMKEFIDYVKDMTKKYPLVLNDMNLLGIYPKLKPFPCDDSNENGIIDACCLGQILDGTHKVPGVSFVNETATFEPDRKKIKKKKNAYWYGHLKIHSLHIHSKQLHKFFIK